jgi:hypothetical protein
MGMTIFSKGECSVDQSGWRARVGAWSQRARETPVDVWLMSGTIGLLGVALLFWGVFLLADGILDQIGTS